MYATERQESISRFIATDGRVSVVDLARRFDVTTETVRRDLAQLESAGRLRRVHGGAVAATRVSTAEVSWRERAAVNRDAKLTIARHALTVIPTESAGSVYLDAGTTTAVIAQLLTERPAGAPELEVVTHSMTIAHILAGARGLRLTAIGGRVRGLTGAAVGAQTVGAIAHLRPDIAFIGTNGVSAAFGLSTPDPDEAAVKRAIIEAARQVCVVADADKFDIELLESFGRLDDIDLLITDVAPAGELGERLHAAEVEVWAP